MRNRQTKRGKTGTKGQVTTRTRSEKSECANDASPPHMRGSDEVHVEYIDHGLICKEETLQMVSDHVAHMMLRAIGEALMEPWYIGKTSTDTNHDVNGNNDTEGIPEIREDQHLQTSVWIVKATACIIAKLYFSRPKYNAENLNQKRTKNPWKDSAAEGKPKLR